MKHPKFNRIMSLLLTLTILTGSMPLRIFPFDIDSHASEPSPTEPTEQSTHEILPDDPSSRPIIYDTLWIAVDGEEETSISIQPHEKVTVQAIGLEEDATYQWQIRHPEKDDLWVDIYDGTSAELSVTYALVGNMLTDENTATLRCRAYTEDYAYLTHYFTVSLQEEQSISSASAISEESAGLETTASGDAEPPEFVTVTIKYEKWEYQYDADAVGDDKYVLTDMGPAFSSYVATLQYNGSLNTTVANPTIIGYAPYLGDAEESTANVEINKTNITEDIVITVNYKPAKVKYEVHYYFQNIYDDLYTEDATIGPSRKAEGITGLPPIEGIKREFNGFTSLFYQPDTIAADGSTIFEVYYERNYYLMEFDCDGGFGVHAIYVRHGTYVSVATPQKAGYVFDTDGDGNGWDLVMTDESGTKVNCADGVADTIPSTMPAYNTSYKALWTTSTTTYTVVYWRENANDEGYSYWGSKQVSAKSASKISGAEHETDDLSILSADYDHFTYNNEKTLAEENARTDLVDGKVIVEGDGSTIVNVYYSAKQYTLKFYYAMSSGSGNNIKYYVIGGSSYYFGNWATVNNLSDDIALLSQYNDTQTSERGEVEELPQLKEDKKGNYASGTEKSTVNGTEYQYYYISFSAKYGADISGLWPCDVFNSVTRVYGNTKNDWRSNKAFVSAWNGEHHVYYSQHNGNQTIKGKYERLDEQILWDFGKFNAYADDQNTVSYLCFWENGADVDWSVPELYRYNIYLEALSEQDLIDKTTYTRDNVTYYLADTYDTCDNSNVNEQTQPSLTGYTPRSNEGSGITDFNSNLYREAYSVNFYYIANRNNLSFHNYNKSLSDVGGETAYNTLIKDALKDKYANITDATYMQTNFYPEGIEPNAYVFVGWYTSPGCYDGTEVDWENLTMPDGDLTLYAKWTPVVRNVSFYLLYTDVEKGNYWQPEGETIEYPIQVPHGQLLGTTYNYIPDRGEDYQFVGWFYFDENGKKRFAPDSMKVTRDLDLFAEWYSTISTTYEVKYEAWSEKEGVYTLVDNEIAKPTEGYSTAGKTTTFNAKGGTALYDKKSDGGVNNYQSLWFPEHSSHSILMDEDSTKNTHTFRYFHKEHINYKVMYIDRSTGAILGKSEVKKTTNAIVTEKFVPFEDYLPENYYIEKAIAYDPTDYTSEGNENHVQPENIIYFYYNPDATHDPFHIEHWYENLDGTYTLTYTENGIADNGKEITATPRTTAGYEHDQSQAQVITYYKDATNNWQANAPEMGKLSGNVSEGGLDIKLYYNRITVDYTIKYVYSNTLEELYKTTIEGNKFGSTVSYKAPAVYVVDSQTYIYFDGKDSTDAQRTKSIIVREKAEDNVITFYYNLKQIAVHYHVVCTVPDLDSLNGVSMSMQLITAWDDGVQSTAMPGTGFKFVGWYYDEECKNSVPINWIGDDGLTIHPKETLENKEGEVHFYAKFEPLYGKITIIKSFAEDKGVATDSFLFRVKGKDYNNRYIDLTVSITGAGTATIENVPIGNYDVTELTAWSYEYTIGDAVMTAKVIEDEATKFTFENTYTPSKWLGGEISVDNRFSES